MVVISDSNAVRLNNRVLTQHQAALTLLRSMLSDPRRANVRWLDLACGRGQILTNLEYVFAENKRQRVTYRGFDVSHEYVREAEERARYLFPTVSIDICELQHFGTLLSPDDRFELVTFTNTAHEIFPTSLAQALVDAICVMAPDGTFFMYDMEDLPTPELGAIPLRGQEIQQIFNAFLEAAGVTEFPEVGVWQHKTCTCWDIQIHKAHLGIKCDDLNAKREAMVLAAEYSIGRVLRDKLYRIEELLEHLDDLAGSLDTVNQSPTRGS